MLKIIISNKPSASLHARKLVKRIEAARLEDSIEPNPIGVATYSARFPNVCDDCGETYWSADRYASHPKCKSGSKFGF